MPEAEILSNIAIVISDILGREVGALDREMTADSIEGWDSLSHIQIVVGLERVFDIRFSAAELIDFQNIGALANGIQRKLAEKTS